MALTNQTKWSYSPALQFYMRVLVTAYLDTRGRRADGSPSNEALLARDWISNGDQVIGSLRQHVTFDHCCELLSIDADNERVQLLAEIDTCEGFDTDDAWLRLASARETPIEVDHESAYGLPSYARAVPALDQMSFFAPRMTPSVPALRSRVLPHPVALRVTRHLQPCLATGLRVNVSASAHAACD